MILRRTKLQIVIDMESRLSQYFVPVDTFICPTESGYIVMGRVVDEGKQ